MCKIFWVAGAHRAAPSREKLLLGGGGFCGGVGVFLLEAFDASGGVHKFLLAGEEGMAIRADFNAQHVAFDGRARLKGVTAGAMDSNWMIVGVNTGFHETPFCRGRSARLWWDTVASLGREALSMIRKAWRIAKSRERDWISRRSSG